MSNKKPTNAELQASLDERKEELKRVNDAHNRLIVENERLNKEVLQAEAGKNEAMKLVTVRDQTIEGLKRQAVPSHVQDSAKILKESVAKFKAGLYVASAAPMYCGETDQHFTISKPLKVTEDQLGMSWYILQLAHGTIKPYVE